MNVTVGVTSYEDLLGSSPAVTGSLTSSPLRSFKGVGSHVGSPGKCSFFEKECRSYGQ